VLACTRSEGSVGCVEPQSKSLNTVFALCVCVCACVCVYMCVLQGIAGLAARAGICCHVDACLGGFCLVRVCVFRIGGFRVCGRALLLVGEGRGAMRVLHDAECRVLGFLPPAHQQHTPPLAAHSLAPCPTI
jgi:hypothetical protein